MSRPFLFGNTQQAQSKYPIEFKAGRMTLKGTTVSPLVDKGLLYLHQTEDSLVHLCWKNRTSGTVEDDLILFPEDAEFQLVPQCTTGRVIVLKFKSGPQRNFYWIQEPKEDKDAEILTKMNDFITNPPPPGFSRSGGSSSGGGGLGQELSSIPENELHSLLQNMTPQQLMQMLGSGMSGSGSLANLLGGSSSPSGRKGSKSKAGSGTGATAGSSVEAVGVNEAANRVHVDLGTSINQEALVPLLSNVEFMQKVKTHLPPVVDSSGEQAPVPDEPVDLCAHLNSTVSSPQFQQSLTTFSSALQTGQLGPLMHQFSLPADCIAAANAGDLVAFVKGLEKDAADKKDDPMNLD